MARKTKQQRESEQKSNLRRRVMDIALGANSGCELSAGDTEADFWRSMGTQDFFVFLRAVQNVFPQDRDTTQTYDIWNLHNFEDIDQAVEWLWENGIRP